MTDPVPETLAERLVRLRKARLLSRAALAKASGIGYGTLRDLERGIARAPHMSTIRKLTDALGLDAAERAGFEAAALAGRASGQRPDPSGDAAPDAGPDRDRDADKDEASAADTVTASLLPHDIGSFTGRHDELRRLVTGARGIAGNRGVAGIFVIEGMGGIGKTTLGVHAAHLVADGFPDGQLFLDLQGYTTGLPALTSHQALRSLLRALGVPNELVPAGHTEREAFYRNTVAGKRLLIICDNASSAAQVRPLIPGTGGSLIIVTSRTSLRSLDDAKVLSLRTPPEADAIALFRAIAGDEHADDPELAEIVRLCGLLPLAVRIVAARLSRRPALRAADILDELRHEHGRLANLEDEERSVTAVFESSLRTLPDPAERLLFQRLSLIPGPDFDVFAAASLTGAAYQDTWRLLESLLDHNLLMQQIPGRYRFHDLVRMYARTHQVSGAGQAIDNLLNYYLRAARLADQFFERGLPRPGPAGAPGTSGGPVPELATPAQAQAWLAAELTNLNAAAHLAARRKRPDVTIGLSSALSDYLRAYGPWPQAAALHRAALRAATETRDLAGQASALRGIGGVLSRTGEIGQSKEMLTEAVAIYRRLGDRRGTARALIELGIAQRVSGDVECLGAFTEALTAYTELGDRHGQAAALNELGSVRWQIGPISDAKQHLLDALWIYRELGNRQGQAAALLYLGNVQLVLGELGAAEQSFTEAGAIGRELGQPVLVANSQLYLGDVQRAAGLLDDAEKALNSALKSYTRLRHRQGVATALAYLGKTLILAGKHTQAERALREALTVFGELGDRNGQAETLNAYAALAIAAGRPDTARDRYTRALRCADQVSSVRDKADALSGLASLSEGDGDTDAAVAGYWEALALYESMRADADVARVRQVLARLGDTE